MIPYLCVHNDYNALSKEIAHKIKGENAVGQPISNTERDMALDIAARDMALLCPRGAVLVPVPSHHGYATDTLLLARKIALLSNLPVKDILKGKNRESSYDSKKNGREVEDFGFYLTEDIKENIVYIDNCISSGRTAREIYKMRKGTFLVYVCVSGVKGFSSSRLNTGNTFLRRGNMRHMIF